MSETTILFTKEGHKHFGQRLKGSIYYYDHLHTGSSDDLFKFTAPDGKNYRAMSSDIDVKDYNLQLVAIETKRLGANVGDTVIIERSGSGRYAGDFDEKKPHVISYIGCNGSVHFDDGQASFYRPDVRVLEVVA